MDTHVGTVTLVYPKPEDRTEEYNDFLLEAQQGEVDIETLIRNPKKYGCYLVPEDPANYSGKYHPNAPWNNPRHPFVRNPEGKLGAFGEPDYTKKYQKTISFEVKGHLTERMKTRNKHHGDIPSNPVAPLKNKKELEAEAKALYQGRHNVPAFKRDNQFLSLSRKGELLFTSATKKNRFAKPWLNLETGVDLVASGVAPHKATDNFLSNRLLQLSQSYHLPTLQAFQLSLIGAPDDHQDQDRFPVLAHLKDRDSATNEVAFVYLADPEGRHPDNPNNPNRGQVPLLPYVHYMDMDMDFEPPAPLRASDVRRSQPDTLAPDFPNQVASPVARAPRRNGYESPAPTRFASPSVSLEQQRLDLANRMLDSAGQRELTRQANAQSLAQCVQTMSQGTKVIEKGSETIAQGQQLIGQGHQLIGQSHRYVGEVIQQIKVSEANGSQQHAETMKAFENLLSPGKHARESEDMDYETPRKRAKKSDDTSSGGFLTSATKSVSNFFYGSK